MARFFTADWHLGETRLDIMQRPFAGPNEMFSYMRDLHNVVVNKGDELIVVGDVVSKASKDANFWLTQVSAFNGKKTLIRGNHDTLFTDEQLSPYFDTIINEGDGIDFDIDCPKRGKLKSWATHYPTQGVVNKFNLVGHIHSSWKVQLNMLNVGVDVHHFAPVNENKIPFFLDAISSFYDQDVWVGDYKANSAYKGIRGKTGTYFNGK